MAQKSNLQIFMDLVKAREQANKLDEAAKSIRKESSRFEECRADIKQSWEGDNANSFTGKMGIVSDDLAKIAKQLEKTADVIRKNAQKIHDAEMEAKRLAEIRK